MDSLENRFSIGYSLEHSAQGTPVPPPQAVVEPVPAPEPYPIEIAGARARMAVDGDGQVTPIKATSDDSAAEEDNDETPTLGPASAIKKPLEALPSYLRLTSYGERVVQFGGLRNARLSDLESRDDELMAHLSRKVRPSEFEVPRMYPSRATAEAQAAGVWQTANERARIKRASDVLDRHRSSSPVAPGPSQSTSALLGSDIATPEESSGSGATHDRYYVGGRAPAGVPSSASSSSKPHNVRLAPRAVIGLPPLPTCWVKKGEDNVEMDETGTTLKAKRDVRRPSNDTVVLRTDHPVPDNCGIFYYEVTVCESGEDDLIGVGLCDEKCPLVKMPGLETKSFGYHGDDGRIIVSQGAAKPYGPHFGKGDVIGCGYNLEKKHIFFTKNGLSLQVAFTDVSDRLYPTIGLKSSHVVETNFGAKEFVYDIDQYVREQKQSVLRRIRDSELRPRELRNAFDLKFVEDLVASYFSHFGLIESAKAFQREKMEDGDQPQSNNQDAMDIDAEEDDDVSPELKKLDHPRATQPTSAEESEAELKHRQVIRSLVVEGKIADAMKQLELFYPEVLKNDIIVFKLKCRQFVELVRRTVPCHPDKLGLTEVIKYGQQLQEEYKNDKRPFIGERLEQIFTLLAYEDPSADPMVAELLSPSHLRPLAEELNSAMVVSKGMPSVAPLQRIAQHVTQMVWELADQGDSAASLINVHRDYL
ncbi:hypothetical protein TRVA0_015S01596 [Trichomonascus vanleenenianus]|uniref:glucose-induced degradation complex subunit VID30 n=1 Tax=Trichomonascus vanleenenianus TaxID=2268995 RepID=UPI003EC9EF63